MTRRIRETLAIASLGAISALLLGACGSATSDDPDTQEQVAAEEAACHGAPANVRVMTRNLYLGADITPIVGALAYPDPANPYAVPIATGQAIATVLGTNVPDRMGAVADEIAVTLPHVVGLQEVTTYTIADPTGQLPATIDFLEILQGQLAARGLDYEVVSTVDNFGVPAPGLPACLSADCSVVGYVALQDHDVLLVRSDVKVNAVLDPVTYQAAVPLGDGLPPITRGLVAANLTVSGKTFTAVNTHLELGGATEMAQIYQAQEFIARFGSAGPVIALGDFNASADGSTAYDMLTGAGFKDRWTTNMLNRDGYTCCFDETATTGPLYERIDLIFTKDLPVSHSFSWRIGAKASDRIESGQYPSDHAGVVSWIFLKK